MPISVVCETCGTKLKAPDTTAGKKVKCPKCANLISVSAGGDEAASAVSSAPAPPKSKTKEEPLDELDELSEVGDESPRDEAAGEEDAAKNRGPVSQDDMTWGLLAHLAGTFFGWLGALIVFLMKKDESAFLRHHTKEALNFQLTMIPMWILVVMLSCCINCGGSLAAVNNAALYFLVKGVATLPYMALAATDVILGIMAAMAAKKGDWYKYPFSFRMIK